MTAVAVVAVALGAAAQAVTGLGFSLVSAPLLVAAVGAPDGVRLNVALSVLVNVAVLAGEWRRVRWRDAAHLLVPAAVATPLAGLAVRGADPSALAVAAGALVVASAAALGGGLRVERLRGRAGAVGAGALSAAMNVVAGVGGPAVAVYALNAGWPPAALRPTFGAYFLGLNLAALAVLGGPATTTGPGLAAGLVVALAVGFVAGAHLARRLDAAAARRVVLVLATGGGLAAVARGLA